MGDNRPHADNCNWMLGNQSCECGYYARKRAQEAADALADKLLAEARTKVWNKLHTASDLADARRAGYASAQAQASLIARRIESSALKIHGHPGAEFVAGCADDIAWQIEHMIPDGETTT